MPHTISPFPEIRLRDGCTRFPGDLPRSLAAQVKPIHEELRANLSHHPEEKERLVCQAFQQCYDLLWGFYKQNGAAYSAALEAALGEKAFHIAQDCKWLPEAARIDSLAWREWVSELIADRFKWTGFEDCSQSIRYLRVPFPKETNGVEISEIPESAEEVVAIAEATGGERQKPGLWNDAPAGTAASSGTGSERRAAVDAYIDEVLRDTGKRITRTAIWKKAGDKTRTEFERWESCWYENHGRKMNKAANRRFNRILTDKPH
jgi:hypothetical protein